MKMKKTITLLTMLVYFFTWSQEEVEKFQSTPNGLNGYVVKQFEGKETSEIFEAIKKWGEYNIYNADHSIKSKINNEYLIYKLSYEKGLHFKTLGVNWYYDVELDTHIRIKKDRVRFDIDIISIRQANPKNVASNSNVQLIQGSEKYLLFKKNGKPRKNTQSARDDIEGIANGIVSSVSDAILGKADTVSDNW